MQQNKIAILLIWCSSCLLCYTLNIFGFLASFLTGGTSYYIALLILFFFLFYHYYFYEQKNNPIRIRALFKPFFQSFILFIIILLILSFLFPETFKETELRSYEAKFLTNGYSGSEISGTIKMINKLYYIFLILGSFVTHFFISLISIFLFKIFVIVKSKLVNKKV